MGMFRQRSRHKVLFVTTEEFPFAKVGGLGEVMFSLPRALAREGADVRVMLPRYGGMDDGLLRDAAIEYRDLAVPVGPERNAEQIICTVRKLSASKDARSPVTTYFLENEEYYGRRANVYGYEDDQRRFALLSRACLEFLRWSDEWMPDIIVSTDWMTGYLPNYLGLEYRQLQKFRDVISVFSIHNIYSQGPAQRFRFTPESELDDGHGPLPSLFDPRLSQINSMRRGILHSDVVNTVSPTYAKEIMTPASGEGLDGLLREKRGSVFGILNGIDYDVFDPGTDPLLAVRYSAKNPEARAENKRALARRFGLPENPDAFLVGIVSRLDRLKGLTLLEPVIADFIRATGAQLILVGTGDPDLMDFFRDLEESFPENVRAHLRYDAELPHLIFGGADAVLMPSRSEPCGLTQMEAMRYGAIPVVRKTGGLADTVNDFDPAEGKGTGFAFADFEPTQLLIALIRAYVNWRHKDSWLGLVREAMSVDFSWDRSAREYMTLFETAKKRHTKTEKRKNVAPRTL